jgi:hypothetical protein
MALSGPNRAACYLSAFGGKANISQRLPAFQLFMLSDASKHDTSFMCVRPASRYPKPPPPSGAVVVGVIGWMASAGPQGLVLPWGWTPKLRHYVLCQCNPIGGSLVGGEEWLVRAVSSARRAGASATTISNEPCRNAWSFLAN